MEDVDKHSLIWRMFMTSSMHAAAIFLEKITSRICTPYGIQVRKQLYRIFVRCELSGVSELSRCTSTCEKLSLVNDEVMIKIMKAKVHVVSDSVLCVRKVREYPKSNIELVKQIGVVQEHQSTTD